MGFAMGAVFSRTTCSEIVAGSLVRLAGSPAWSPDGSKIAFVSLRDQTFEEIYIMNSDGTGQVNITNSDGYDGMADWSN